MHQQQDQCRISYCHNNIHSSPAPVQRLSKQATQSQLLERTPASYHTVVFYKLYKKNVVNRTSEPKISLVSPILQTRY